MPLTSGSRLGAYEVLAPLGSGGMGEVYRARDTKLGRDVALKVLPDELASDPTRRSRFEQEARAASALDHPNIVTIHDIAEADGRHFIVMQLVEGETLREVIERGRLDLKKTLGYASQLADGLARAHGEGIVHRDLKPDNVMVTEDGRVKILDFGLAKLVERALDSEASTRDMARPLTEEGRVMGTAPYMSPEQAQGEKVDARSDIFSFGSVLYEMVTGRRAFTGKTVPELLTSIIREEPERVSELVPSVPHELERLIQRALRKEPERRFQSMADVRVELEEIRDELESGSYVSAETLSKIDGGRPSRRRWWLAAGLVVIVASVAGWWYLSESEPLPPPRTIPITSYPGKEGDPALSPDGRLIAFTRIDESGSRDLYVKQIDGGEPLALSAGSGNVYTPAWSPDGERIAFIRHDESLADAIHIVPALGGAARHVGTFEGGHGLSWSPDGRLLAFSHSEVPDHPASIYLLSVESGETRKLTASPPDVAGGDSAPRFSPDGRTVAFARGGAGQNDIYRVSVEGRDEWPLTFSNTNTSGFDWTSDGKSLVFSAGRTGRVGIRSLWRVSAGGGEPEPLEVGDPGAFPSISRLGNRLAYERRDANWNIWREPLRPGTSETERAERLIAATGVDYMPRYSPDGKKIAFASTRSGPGEIWVCEGDGSNPRQLTRLEHPITVAPHWSPDGERIAFWSNKGGSPDIYVVNATGGIEQRLTTDDWNEHVVGWSRNGRSIYLSSNRTGSPEVWRMIVESGNTVQVTRNGGAFAFESPDGRFVYLTKQTPGRGPPGIWRMPIEGGEEELVLERIGFGDWTSTDRGIYYVNRDAEAGPTVELFDFATEEVSPVAVLEHAPMSWWLSVSPDEQWILYVRDEDESDIMLVENFR